MAYWNGTAWVPDRDATSSRSRTRLPRILGAATEAGLITLLIFGMVAGTTLAAKGGGGGPARTTATLTVSPDSVLADGADYSVAGSGFKPNTAVNVVISMPTCCAFFTVTADAEGDVWFVYQTGAPGTYTIEANQRLNGRKLTLMASTTFTVTAP